MRKQGADATFQSVQVEWLGEKILHLHGSCALGYLAGKGAHEDDGDFSRGWLAFKDFTDGQPIQVGQQDVQQNQIRFELPCLAQGLDTIICDQKIAFQIGQTELDEFNEIHLVIDNQNLSCHKPQGNLLMYDDNSEAVKVRLRNGDIGSKAAGGLATAKRKMQARGGYLPRVQARIQRRMLILIFPGWS